MGLKDFFKDKPLPDRTQEFRTDWWNKPIDVSVHYDEKFDVWIAQGNFKHNRYHPHFLQHGTTKLVAITKINNQIADYRSDRENEEVQRIIREQLTERYTI